MGKKNNKYKASSGKTAPVPTPVPQAPAPSVTPQPGPPEATAADALEPVPSETKAGSLLGRTKALLQAVMGSGSTEAEAEPATGTVAELEARLAEAVKQAEEALAACQKREEKAKAREQDAETDLLRLLEQQADLDRRATSAQEKEADLEQRISNAQEQLARLAEQRQQLTRQEAELKEREARFLEEKEDLVRRELNAQAGFAEQRRESLRQLEEEAGLLQQQLSENRERLTSERATWEAERASARNALDTELKQKRLEHETRLQEERAEHEQQRQQEREEQEEQLRREREEQQKHLRQERERQEEHLRQERERQEEHLRQERVNHEGRLRQTRKEQEEALHGIQRQLELAREALRTTERSLEKREEQLGWDREDLLSARANLDQRLEQRAAAHTEELEHRLRALQERLDVASRERDRLERILGGREEADRRFGHQTPEQVLAELAELRQERDKLKESLASRPGAEAARQLRELLSQKSQWEAEQFTLQQENQELKNALTRQTIAVSELEALRDHKASLQSSRDLLQAALEDLRKDVDERIRRSDGTSPFPSLSLMDADDRLSAPQLVRDAPLNLKSFVEELQHRIAQDPDAAKAGKVLFYPPEVLRSFVAGLAMSPLLLLQGSSGTGKTTLPLAFARAIGAGGEVVEVQAGWRDKQDLIGHFNAFERRFYEAEFLQALYKARCPHFKDVPFLIVLDEMNLSHPEQYFADLLSAMELEARRQKLRLMTAPAEPSPVGLEHGRMLPLPQNVWFIGTANHDETTKEFADKTYDRAHVMEFLRAQPKQFKPQAQPLEKQNPLGLEALRRAFEQAKDQHAKQAVQAYGFLRDKLESLLERRFRISLSNRLERQMMAYVPVILAAGGSLGEATDHILATKLLRKLRNQHDTRGEDLIKLREQLLQEWPRLDATRAPTSALALIDERRKHLGVDDEEEAA
ncbi:AAA family ATPase [Archangium violaceum]|uniref:AAA family ATPase n=1 Tax=Archangium violaceum TaxID=83451 RepID=UPI000696FD85|nr:AAA family ATPase [Archangium violaceum]